MRAVSVIGIGETKMGRQAGRGFHDLIREAGNKAIDDAGVGASEIQAAYVGNFNGSYLCGQSHLGAMVSEVLGLGYIPTVRTEAACASGSQAFRYAYLAVACGIYDTVLVGGVEKMTHRTGEEVTTAVASAMDFELEAAAGLTFPASFAMIANRYF
jgi:acetyl-CoA C-acetyltransferase